MCRLRGVRYDSPAREVTAGYDRSTMFSVVFEVVPRAGHFDAYLANAKLLKPEIERIDGFIDNERFASRSYPGRILSHSTWRDEKALVRWRTLAVHHEIQEKGRFEIFSDYHLHVGEIVTDTHAPAGQRLDQQRFDFTETGTAKYLTILEVPAGVPFAEPHPGTPGLVEFDCYESIHHAGNVFVLSAWIDLPQQPSPTPEGVRRRTVRVIREYGMFSRSEAPQYYADVAAVE